MNANKLALDALKTCAEHGYVDIDRDWVCTFSYDKEKVAAAIAALEAIALPIYWQHRFAADCRAVGVTAQFNEVKA